MYRFCRYRRGEHGQIESEIFEIEEKAMLKEYLKTEEKGWYKHHKDVPLTEPEDTLESPYLECHSLLSGEGLNHSSFTRAILHKDVITQIDKNKTKSDYDKALKHFKDKIYKQNKDWFLNADNNS